MTKSTIMDIEEEFSTELEEWLAEIAATCIAHMKYIEDVEDDTPEALSVEDYGLLELERAFLTIYALRMKGAIEVDVSKTH